MLPLTLGITTFLLFIIFLILNHFGFLFEFNSKASIFPSLSSPLLYLSVILLTSFNFLFDYTFKLIEIFMNKSLSSKLLLTRTINKGKSSIKINYNNIQKMNSSRPYNFSTGIKRNSVQISRNFLINRLPYMIEQINSQNKTPVQRAFHRYQSSKMMNQ
jgi:hypothetical protein